MCLGFIASVLGVIAGAVGLECIAIMKASKAKVWTGRGGGISMLLAGIVTIKTNVDETLTLFYIILMWRYVLIAMVLG